MPKIARMARKAQPGLLMVDRTVHGEYENYQTPEQKIPDTQLAHPWESCMTLGGAWGFVHNDQYKPASVVIHKLVEIVAKGGSLLLGIGPDADGTLPKEVVSRLDDIGQWTAKNGKAIYNTRITKNYHSGQTWFTQSKDAKTIYAIYCRSIGENPAGTISWTGNLPGKGTDMILLSTGKKVKWKSSNGKTTIELPGNLMGAEAALAFAFTPEN